MTDALTLSKFRHSCLLLDIGGTRLLLDPGGFSSGFESLTDLAAVLITHQHPDHLDLGRLVALIQANPEAEVIADSASAGQLNEEGISARVVSAGDSTSVAGIDLQVYGGTHAPIAPGVPTPPNVGYSIGGLFAYAGDAYAPPPDRVQVVAIPTAAPWLRAADTIEFLQGIRPMAVVPVHEAMLATTDLYYGLYKRFANEAGIEFHVLDDGQPVAF